GWLDAIHPSDRGRVAVYWRDLVTSPRTDTVEYRVSGSDGAYRWVLSRAVPLFGEAGEVREWVGTVSNINGRKLAELRQLEQKERYRAIVEASASAFWRATPEGAIQEVFSWGDFEVGRLPDVTGAAWLLLIHPDDRTRVQVEWGRTLESGRPFLTEYRIKLGESYTWVQARAAPLRSADGSVQEWVGTIANIQAQKEAEHAFRLSEDRYRLAARATQDAIWDWDLVFDQITWGQATQTLFGYSDHEIDTTGSWWKDLIHPEDRGRVVESIHTEIDSGHRHWTSEYRFRRADGTYADVFDRGFVIRNEAGSAVRMVGAMQDISARKSAERELWLLANHDPLTGLANRSLFHARLRETLAEAEQGDGRVSLLLLDLDNFKDVNDTLGHDAGDAVLFEVARRLSDSVPEADLVARLGGDEFAVIVVGPMSLDEVTERARSAMAHICEAFDYDGRSLSVRSSVGIAAFPDHDRAADELLKAADMALFKAKGNGRSRVETYTPALRSKLEQRVTTLNDVRNAIGEARVVPFYQPKVCLTSGRITGFEALARWLHPTRGALSPYHFSAALDDQEVCALIGREIVASVGRDLREWLDAGLECGRVAVNFSPCEFSDPKLADRLLRALDDARIPAANFEVEVTETVLIDGHSSYAAATLKSLEESGVQIALDDFGTGYASLKHLREFPVGHIKIDQSFVSDLEADRDDAAIVRAVIGLGRSLDLHVTAEGVETEGQARWLVENGCGQAQGYLFASRCLPRGCRGSSKTGTAAQSWSISGDRWPPERQQNPPTMIRHRGATGVSEALLRRRPRSQTRPPPDDLTHAGLPTRLAKHWPAPLPLGFALWRRPGNLLPDQLGAEGAPRSLAMQPALRGCRPEWS
ncbi:EAL domain-containing protein, partial [Micromonospora sp. STR1s_5]|nr:EAL domain-containing protein [Micromonospora sp. STR1s_5]